MAKNSILLHLCYFFRSIYKFLNAFLYSFLCSFLYINPYTHQPIYTYILIYIHTYIHIYIFTYIHIYIHTYINKYIHIYIVGRIGGEDKNVEVHIDLASDNYTEHTNPVIGGCYRHSITLRPCIAGVNWGSNYGDFDNGTSQSCAMFMEGKASIAVRYTIAT